jgi:hypothetical protein
MSLTADAFRALMPAFADAEVHPTSAVEMWLGVAAKQMNVERWGDLIDHGASLFVAHNLSLQMRANREADFGKTPGSAFGPTTSKSVDKASVSYDTSSASEEGAGSFNLTVFGQQYIRLARLLGAGPVHLGSPQPGAVLYPATAYAGPYLG